MAPFQAPLGAKISDLAAGQKQKVEIRKHRVYVLPEEPLRNACAPRMSVAENIAQRTFDRPPLARGGILLSERNVRLMGERMAGH
jgi:simple sugar transport system ATP-binding protein